MGCCLCVLRIAYRAVIVLGFKLSIIVCFLLELYDIINIRKIKKGVSWLGKKRS